MLDDLQHHFIVCGFGRMGQIVAQEFSRQSVPSSSSNATPRA